MFLKFHFLLPVHFMFDPQNVLTFCLPQPNCVIFRYIFGITHVPRLEDWPVMPVERIGFMLMVINWLIVLMDLFREPFD